MELRRELATKAIGIVGSPRKSGNVDRLVQAVLDGAEEAGYETDKYHLNELSYSGCQGCNYCKSHENCKIDDDLSEVLEGIREADAVVFGSPIYFYLFSGQFKLMEDRMYSFVDAGFTSRLAPGKKAVIVTSQGNPDLTAFEKAANEFAGILKRLGFEVAEIIRMGGGGAPDAVLERKDLLEKARAAGGAL
ncbi:MAG TPA: flavodoxin family protein [Methanothrix sp.]|mgnify:CR=1 FL=1|nr:flavodoxin family protein [Methanothrix sp.]